MLDRSDFVTCILPLKPPANLIFELGIAIGLSKPLLLFAEDPLNVPVDLASSRALNSDLISTDGLNAFLEAFLRTIPPSPAKRRSYPRTKSPPTSSFWLEIRSELSLVQSLPSGTIESKMEPLIKRAFQRAGFNVTASPGRDFGADFALASPALNKTFGLPVLVEVKNNSQLALQQSEVDKLWELVRNKRGGAGLIVTYKDPKTHPRMRLPGPIAIISVGELLGWLEAGSFADELVYAVDGFWALGE